VLALFLPEQEQPVLSEPTLSADALLEQLRGRFEHLCQEVAAAVNQAPAGQVIKASEEKVRDLLADCRLATYQAALQLRTDAAQAAFPPSAAPADRKASPEQGAG
jgi:Rod binding domain-containing protein